MFSASPSRHVQSVRTAFRIISILQSQGGASLDELSEALDLAKSTLHNHVNTLESMGYVVKRGSEYRLGLRFLTHGMSAKSSLGLDEVIHTALTNVSEETSQIAWWITEEFGRGYFVHKVHSEDSQEIYGRVGKRSYLHTHAPGKAILAMVPSNYRQQIIEYHGLPVHTTQTVTSAGKLQEQLDTIREQGYAFTEGEAALGVQSTGVAFEDPRGIYHAIGVFGYSHDFGGSQMDEGIPSLLQNSVDQVIEKLYPEGKEQ